MRIWRNDGEIPQDLSRTVVTIGNFDGVHRGHQHVLRRAREVADQLGVDRVVVVTFDPHPLAVLRPEHAPATLTGIAERLELLEQAGADDVFLVPFSREISQWTPEEFVDRIIVGALHAKAVVVGTNFRFGHKAAGDVALLREAGESRDFQVDPVPLDGGPQVWSSTYIRTCLASGDVAGAAEALGRLPTVRGVVEVGDRRGRELGFPTANIPANGVAAPADGVYAGWLTRLDTGDRWPAAISVGTNPTFAGERDRRVEAYALDRDDLELYGVPVEVAFAAHLRGVLAFDGIDPLVDAMCDDVRRTREALDLPQQ